MRALDVVMFVAMFCGCVALAAGLVTGRQRCRNQARQIWVLEQQVNGLYLAADWDVPAPFLGDDQGAQ